MASEPSDDAVDAWREHYGRKPVKLYLSKEWCMNAARSEGNQEIGAGPMASEQTKENKQMPDIGILVDRFLAWKLPASVCSDLCVTDAKYPHARSGTNLLTADEARQMIEHLLKDPR